jgi:pyruvate dehydrogenase E2 component (dihydrolipoamide acetyltransferase)
MDVKLPNLGEGADSGTVVSILVKPGAQVRKGQNIIELETGKAVAPIPAPADGKVGRVAVKEGDKLNVGQLILVLETAGGGGSREPAAKEREPEKAPAAAAPKSGTKPRAAASPVAVPPAVALPLTVAAPVIQEMEGEFVEEIVNESPAAGPNVRRVARDLGIDLRVIRGSGKSGQILVGDLKDYVARLRELAARPRLVVAPPVPVAVPAAAAAPAKPAPVAVDFAKWGPVTRKPLTQLRRTIAERMVASATSLPSVTQFDEADVTGLDALRKKHAAAFEAKGARLTLTSFVLKAVAALLKKHPAFNASLDETSNEVVFKNYVHLGLAVDTEAGLLVPVIRDADQKGLLQLSKEIQDVAVKARERKVGLADLQGGTFTISNQGGIGGGHFTPIINQPEVAILGLGRSAWKPAVVDGQVVPRLLLPLALTYDHRLIDGGAAARFAVDLVAALAKFDEAELVL